MRRFLCRKHYPLFLENTWRGKNPLLFGFHTRRIASRLDHALADYRAGKSTFLIITVPHRHGKSDLSSRYFPAFILGQAPDAEVMLVSYAASLSESFSRDILSIMQSIPYRYLFPWSRVAKNSKAVSRWGIEGKRGKLTPVGIGGSITGKGADVLIIDDYLKNRSESESLALRDKIWDAFTNDLMTRLAPICICLIVATRWHQDDLIGRIQKRMQHDKGFPQFEILKFPAKSKLYPDGILFPERFSSVWYEQQFSALGPYGSAALLQCDPVARSGNLLKIDKLVFHDSLIDFPDSIRYFRFWDLASTAKERLKDDPDYTVGCCIGLLENGAQRTLFIKDVRRFRCEAPERNRRIVETAKNDGSSVLQGVEAVAGYKDAYTLLSELLAGHSRVKKINVRGDKVTRAAVLEPLFESGRVHLLRAQWNNELVDELSAFPACAHDDQVDALSGAVHMAIKGVHVPVEHLVNDISSYQPTLLW